MKRIVSLGLLLLVAYSYADNATPEQEPEKKLEQILREEANPRVREFIARAIFIESIDYTIKKLGQSYSGLRCQPYNEYHDKWPRQVKKQLKKEFADVKITTNVIKFESIWPKIKDRKFKELWQCRLNLKKYVDPLWLEKFEAERDAYLAGIHIKNYPRRAEFPEEWLQQILEQQTDPRMRDLCARIGVIRLSADEWWSEKAKWFESKEEQQNVYFSYYEIERVTNIMCLAISDCETRSDACREVLERYVSPEWYKQFCREKKFLNDSCECGECAIKIQLQNWLAYPNWLPYTEWKSKPGYKKRCVYQELIARFALISLFYQDFKSCGDKSKTLVQAWFDKENDIRPKFSIEKIEGREVEKEAKRYEKYEKLMSHDEVASLCQNHQEECVAFFKRYVDPTWLKEFEVRANALRIELEKTKFKSDEKQHETNN